MTLSPRQFFHASTANLTPGKDKLLPFNHPDNPAKPFYGYAEREMQDHDGVMRNRGDFSFATSSEKEAWMWRKPERSLVKSRPTVYAVDPGDEAVDVDVPVKSGDPSVTHAASSTPMDITDRIDIPPPDTRGQVVQGTLPPENWNVYGDHYSTKEYNFRRLRGE